MADRYEDLRRYLAKTIDLTSDEYAQAAECFVPRLVPRGEYLLKAGASRDNNAFVRRGCLRLFSVDTEGNEHVVQFAIEEWWVGDFRSMLTGEPASFNIDALEDSEVLLLSGYDRERLCVRIPKFERFFRLLLERNYLATQRRVHASLSLSKEAQYRALLETYPEIVRRVHQNQIASYLGITPQTLSRIRREMSQGGRPQTLQPGAAVRTIAVGQ